MEIWFWHDRTCGYCKYDLSTISRGENRLDTRRQENYIMSNMTHLQRDWQNRLAPREHAVNTSRCVDWFGSFEEKSIFQRSDKTYRLRLQHAAVHTVYPQVASPIHHRYTTAHKDKITRKKKCLHLKCTSTASRCWMTQVFISCSELFYGITVQVLCLSAGNLPGVVWRERGHSSDRQGHFPPACKKHTNHLESNPGNTRGSKNISLNCRCISGRIHLF